MDVTCEKCRTEYEFDEMLISESGTTVKCTNCGHLFRMYRPGTPESQRHSSWMLRQPDGSVYTFERMTTLQRWIVEGKASRWDMISRTGDVWKTLEEVAELAPFFEKADVALTSRDDEEAWPDDGPTLQRRSPRVASSMERSDPTIKGYELPVAPPPPRKPPPDLSKKPTLPLPMVAQPPPAGRPSSEPGEPAPQRQSAPVPPRAAPAAEPAPARQNAPVPPRAAPAAEPAPAPEAPVSPPARPDPSASPPAAASPPVQPVISPPAAAEPVALAAAPAPEPIDEESGIEPGSLGDVLEPDRQSDNWSEGTLLDDQSPAWAAGDIAPPSAAPEIGWADAGLSHDIDGASEEDLSISPRKRPRRFIAPLVIVALLLIGVGAVWFLKPELLQRLAGEIFTSDTSGQGRSEAYLRGREYFLLDTPEGFSQADRAYHRAGATDGLAQAGVAEVYTTWAQQLLDDVADSQLRATKANAATAPVHTARADIKQELFQQKLEQARRFVEGALNHAGDLPETHRAAADYYRLTGDFEKTRDHIEKALAMAREKTDTLPETEYVKVLVDLARDGDEQAAIAGLEEVLEANDKLVRVHYRLGRLLAAAGKKGRALESADQVLTLSKNHQGAMLLKQALSKNSLVAVASRTIAAQAGQGEADAGPADAGPADAAVAQAEADAAPEDREPTAETTEPREPAAGDDAEPQGFDALVQRAADLQQRSSREACSLFRRADRIRPGHPEVLVGLGYCALDEGRAGPALGLFRRAGSTYGPALIGMAEASRAAGSPQQAIRYYRQYLERYPSGTYASMARRNAERLEEQIGPPEPPPSEEPEPAPPPPSPEPPSPPPTVITPEEPPPSSGSGTPDNPTTIRVTEDRTPPGPRSDSLATDSEPPLRPGEDVE